jgi:hypothetical protein
MNIPAPPPALAALAEFVRERLADVSGTLSPLLSGRDPRDPAGDNAVGVAARQLTTVVVGAAAPFAPTSYARARLIRQMHATGLLNDDQARLADRALALPGRGDGAAR